MGTCYSVTARLRLKERRCAAIALRRYIRNRDGVDADFALGEYSAEGIHTRSFDDLMRIFLAGWKVCPVAISCEDDAVVYRNAFKASYGWERIMMDMFAELSPSLKNGSTMQIHCDGDYDLLEARNGKVVQLH